MPVYDFSRATVCSLCRLFASGKRSEWLAKLFSGPMELVRLVGSVGLGLDLGLVLIFVEKFNNAARIQLVRSEPKQ